MAEIERVRQHIHQRDKLKDKLEIKEIEWTERQKEFIELALDKKTKVLFIKGPAGTAKTFCSVYCLLRLLSEKRISDIIYIRSAVESSDSKIGFLPGGVDEKLHYYNLPFYDKLEEMLKKTDIDKLEKEARISIFPVNFCRGMSWNVKGVVVDECFPGDELVATEAGKIKIFTLWRNFEQNKKTLLIKTFNEATKIFEYKKLIKIWKVGKRKVISVIAGNRKIRCTKDHKFLTDGGWVEASQLKHGNILIANNENTHQANHIVYGGVIDMGEEKDVYDLEVKDNNNFIITSTDYKANPSGVVVHNCQNSSQKEIVTVLTRLGKFNKCFLLADPTQSDLSNGKSGGFEKLYNLFDNQESKDNGIFVFEFLAKDIIRSDLVSFIVSKIASLQKIT